MAIQHPTFSFIIDAQRLQQGIARVLDIICSMLVESELWQRTRMRSFCHGDTGD